jgi:hypothetical protein
MYIEIRKQIRVSSEATIVGAGVSPASDAAKTGSVYNCLYSKLRRAYMRIGAKMQRR